MLNRISAAVYHVVFQVAHNELAIGNSANGRKYRAALKSTLVALVSERFLSTARKETAPSVERIAAIQGVEREQDLADLTPKGCFISTEAVQRIVGQIG